MAKKERSTALEPRKVQSARIYLLPPAVSLQTVHELEVLLAEARSGAVMGLVVAALRRGNEISVNVVGRCRQVPVLSTGMAALLEREAKSLASS